jgi:hypothetical protein
VLLGLGLAELLGSAIGVVAVSPAEGDGESSLGAISEVNSVARSCSSAKVGIT